MNPTIPAKKIAEMVEDHGKRKTLQYLESKKSLTQEAIRTEAIVERGESVVAMGLPENDAKTVLVVYQKSNEDGKKVVLADKDRVYKHYDKEVLHDKNNNGYIHFDQKRCTSDEVFNEVVDVKNVRIPTSYRITMAKL